MSNSFLSQEARLPPPFSHGPPSQLSAGEEEKKEVRLLAPSPGVGGRDRVGREQPVACQESKAKALRLGLRLESGLPGEGACQLASSGTLEAGERFWRLLPKCSGLSRSRGEVSAPPFGGGRTGPGAWVPPGTWKMPVPWFLLSLALGPSPVVLSLEKLMGPQDAARCSPVSRGP